MLQIMVDVDDRNEWKECIDIGGVRLPTGYFFGASAATGDLSGTSKLESFKHTTTIKSHNIFYMLSHFCFVSLFLNVFLS